MSYTRISGLQVCDVDWNVYYSFFQNVNNEFRRRSYGMYGRSQTMKSILTDTLHFVYTLAHIFRESIDIINKKNYSVQIHATECCHDISCNDKNECFGLLLNEKSPNTDQFNTDRVFAASFVIIRFEQIENIRDVI